MYIHSDNSETRFRNHGVLNPAHDDGNRLPYRTTQTEKNKYLQIDYFISAWRTTFIVFLHF
jgi:hypothetical protein